MRRLVVIFASMCVVLPRICQADALEATFEIPKTQGKVINIGDTQDAVGNTLFRGSAGGIKVLGVTLSTGSDPLYIAIIKTILRLTMILGVSMGLIIGIQYILAQWDEWKQKKLQWYIWNIWFGILIALWAFVIIDIVRSISQSSITF